MAKASRLGDNCSCHDACPTVPAVTASGDVLINGRGAVRLGDRYRSHGCRSHSQHQDVVSDGCNAVFANGKPLARVGDPVDHGNLVKAGSPDVFAYDNPTTTLECKCMTIAASRGSAFVAGVGAA